jgi:hypothetical protein
MMKAAKYDMVVNGRQTEENPNVLKGLPQLTSFWLTTMKFKPRGTLLLHLNPPDVDAMTLRTWDKKYYRGNFFVVKVDFWFSDIVQDFVKTVRKTNRDFEGR